MNVAGDEYYDFRSSMDTLVNGRRLNAVNVLLCWLKGVCVYWLFKTENQLPSNSSKADVKLSVC